MTKVATVPVDEMPWDPSTAPTTLLVCNDEKIAEASWNRYRVYEFLPVGDQGVLRRGRQRVSARLGTAMKATFAKTSLIAEACTGNS